MHVTARKWFSQAILGIYHCVFIKKLSLQPVSLCVCVCVQALTHASYPEAPPITTVSD